MRLDASAYKMCVATFPSPLNRTARSRRAGPLPDQLAWETLSRSAREGGEQLPVIATADSLRGLPDHVKQRCAEFVRDTPRQFAEAIMMTLARPLGDNHKAASIYDDHFHRKHYITGMNDLFAEILQSRENDTCGQSMR